MAEAVKIEGLKEFNRALKSIDRELPKAVRIALNQAADVIVSDARPRIPKRKGRARGSLRLASTRTKVRVRAGGSRAPYYPWLDFGGRVGRRRSVRRPFLTDGRYIYRSYNDRKSEFVKVLEESLHDIINRAGLEVD